MSFGRRKRSEKKASGILLRGGSPRDAFDALGTGPRRIWVSAWQSYLFNRVLDKRLEDDTVDRLLEGDIAWLHESSAAYPVRDETSEQTRAATLEASPTGPLLGYDPAFPGGLPGELEASVMAAESAEPDDFLARHCRARGLRRPLRVPVEEASLTVEKDGAVTVRFFLPPGSFATVALDHLMRGGPVPPTTPGAGPDAVRARE